MNHATGNPAYSEAELDRRREFQHSRPLERDETHNLISSDRVEGTPVYATDGERIGSINHLMIGKRSGRVEYAVMSFGGFLGIGESYHPLPWDALDYDTERGGYVVHIDKEKLRDAPAYASQERPLYDAAYGQNVFGYYGIMY
ncbi:PRC-barrel domain containing protein [Altererythrobacter xixiisoli]|uniref:PRC-barrel domain containing protein n=1 Tax=Croceibacterium xixiisoli TaxID=1476466 RepID=A0A6I4TV48_9SPHN|nr:PRC-barrel domain-containing protein [Croceibacterium xixiisoli]MXP00086.1 PRC-barrel domain containing protein [Croceibacterium xixiisoli]